ncbi:MAG: ECF transporter S component [Oscillospiraceae bacterium]|nr:ECF transporter S component [Oscillospiraceae bacterium]
MEKVQKTRRTRRVDVRRLVFTALMAALSIVLAEPPLAFKVGIMPSFMTFDFSDVPAMLASMTMGPVSGVFVCLIKNIFGCFTTKTACVGELSNFILSAALVFPAGLIAHRNGKYIRAVVGCLSGTVLMALMSIPSNYFLVFPAYGTAFGLPIDALVGYYQKILPSVENLIQCLIIFNVPFTLVKGLCAAIISILLYKKLRPVFSGIYRE